MKPGQSPRGLTPDDPRDCARCGELRVGNEFYRRGNRSGGRLSICKACERARKSSYSAEYKHGWYEQHRERLLIRDRFHAYGVSGDQYKAMLTEQHDACAICAQPETALNSRRETKQLSVDHNHDTGQVRGLLCHRCNVGIGLFLESPELLAAAMKYLKSFDTGNGN